MIAAAYVLLTAVLLITRLVGLDRDLGSDEIVTIRDYVDAGPGKILVGDYVPNNHQLFSLLGWLTTVTVSGADAAIRLWSAIPFVAGAVLGAVWLHRRVGALTGVTYLYLTTVSPFLLDLSRQARGYGLAFLAMTVLVVSALEARRTCHRGWVASFSVAGVLGTWTLPHVAIAFGATAVPLLLDPRLRRPTASLLGAACAATLVWYGPHLRAILVSFRQDYAAPIDTAWLITAP
ncbi:MAG: hypothetical protein NZL88_09450, partial [Gaiellaceae bacterium]|nr:hypothetical protein [Gaiellaceae bacterium]